MSVVANNYRTGNTRNCRPLQGARKATTYCKVCHDAGRPLSEYTSHFVKDKKGPDGKVVCPLLLNQECRYCHEKGHTPKECPQLKAKAATKPHYDHRRVHFEPQYENRHAATKPRVQTDASIAARIQRTNFFAALCDSSSDEETVPIKDAFPTLGNKSAPAVAPDPKLTGWVALAAKPAPPKPVTRVQYSATMSRDARDNESEYSEDDCECTEREAWEWKRDYERMKKSWADTDSDEE